MRISALSSVGRASDLYSLGPWFESKRADKMKNEKKILNVIGIIVSLVMTGVIAGIGICNLVLFAFGQSRAGIILLLSGILLFPSIFITYKFMSALESKKRLSLASFVTL